MTEPWWEHLNAAQLERYGGLIDSRVRLLGDSYGHATEYVRANQRDHVMEARTVVTMAELKVLWFRADANQFGLDEQRGVKWLRLDDGTQYEAPLS